MRVRLIIAAMACAISGLVGAQPAQASYLYTLSACGALNCTTPTSTILSFISDTILVAPTPVHGFTPTQPLTGVTAVDGGFTGIGLQTFNFGTPGANLLIDGLIAANGSLYSQGGFASMVGSYNAFIPLTIGLGTYNQLGISACINAECSSATPLISPVLLTVTEVSGVPEPVTWSMLLLGFGAIGAVMRRRKLAVRFA